MSIRILRVSQIQRRLEALSYLGTHALEYLRRFSGAFSSS